MAQSLLDVISGAAPDASMPAAAGQSGDQTQAARRLIGARTGLADAMSGAGPGGATPRASNLGEQSTALTGASTIQRSETGDTAATSALTNKANDISAQRASDSADVATRLTHIRTAATQHRSDLIADYRRSVADLDDKRANASAEQLASDARLSSESYINDLTFRGDVERLGDASRFKVAATQAAIGRDKDLLDQMIGNADWLTADNDTKKRALADIDLDIALQIAGREAQQADVTSTYAGIGNATSGAIQGAKAYSEYKPADEPAETIGTN